MTSLQLIIRSLWKSFSVQSKGSVKTSISKSCVPFSSGNASFNPINIRKYSRTYDANGKTVARIINKKDSPVLCITTIRTDGFVLANGCELVGSLILFPHSILSWHVRNASEVTEDSLTLFKVLEPKLDILVFGYGTVSDYTPDVRKRFESVCKKIGIKFEALPTENAVGVFNFLAEELRFVAGAFIPPSTINVLKLEKRSRRMEDILNKIDDETVEQEQELLDDSTKVKKLK